MKLLICSLLLLLRSAAAAQEMPPELQQQAEQVAEEGLDGAAEEWSENLRTYLRHPLDLNVATAEELALFPFLRPQQLLHLLRYRHLLGPLVHPYELQAVPFWDAGTVRKLLPYIRIGDHRPLGSRLRERWKGDHVSSWLLAGDTRDRDPAFLGSALSLQLRHRYQYRNLAYAGLTLDKDRGERLLVRGGGPDFLSAHVFLRKLGRVEALAVGDFRVRLGQGLIHWDGMGAAPGTDPMQTERASPALMPYRSAGVSGFQRGIGLTLMQGRWQWTSFASRRRLDANLGDDGSSVTSLLTGGLHRTPSELRDRQVLRLTSMGSRMEYRSGIARLAFNAVTYETDKPLEPRAAPYNRFAFRGRRLSLLSADGGFSFRNLHVFGELAARPWNSWAVLGGMTVSLHPKADLSLVYRRFPPSYATLFGHVFSRFREPQNENGLYLGLSVRPASPLTVWLAADLYRSPFLRYRVTGPSAGQSFWLQATLQKGRLWTAYLRVRNTQRPLQGGGAPLPRVGGVGQWSWRGHVDHTSSRKMRISFRAEWNRYRPEAAPAEEGLLIYTEVERTILDRLSAVGRWQWVESDGFGSRIYVYESNVPMSFALPFYQGTAVQTYLLLRYRMSDRLQLQLRWSRIRNTAAGASLSPTPAVQEWRLFGSWSWKSDH